MKVVIISHTYVTDVNRKRLYELAKLGVDLTLVVPNHWNRPMGRVEFQQVEWDQGYRIKSKSVIYSSRQTRYLFFDPTCGLIGEKPDIVHIEQEPFCLIAWQALQAANIFARRAKKIFMTWQNIHVPDYGFPFQHVENTVFRQADCIVCGNREAEDVLRIKGYKGDTFLLPDKGIDLELYKKDEMARSKIRSAHELTGFVVGYIGRIIDAKGIHTLAKAVSKLPDDVQLLFIGGGIDKQRLVQTVENLGLENRTVYQEVVPHRDVPLWLNAMDVMVIPSLTTPEWKEQFGHTIIEAMACGIPVIGSTSGEIPNVIGDAGLIFPEGDEESLANQIRKLYHSKNECLRLSEMGLKYVAQYSHEAIAQRTQLLYQQTLSGH